MMSFSQKTLKKVIGDKRVDVDIDGGGGVQIVMMADII